MLLTYIFIEKIEMQMIKKYRNKHFIEPFGSEKKKLIVTWSGAKCHFSTLCNILLYSLETLEQQNSLSALESDKCLSQQLEGMSRSRIIWKLH